MLRAIFTKNGRMDYQVVFSCIGLLALAILFLVFKVIIPQNHANAIQAFVPYMQQYGSMGMVAVQETTPHKPVKMIVISKSDQAAGAYQGDDLYFELPDLLKAKKPDEVNIVIKIRRFNLNVGTYTNGGSALQQGAEVSVIDVSDNSTIANQTFFGSMPPDSVSGSGGSMGSSPDKDIIKYLESLNDGQ